MTHNGEALKMYERHHFLRDAQTDDYLNAVSRIFQTGGRAFAKTCILSTVKYLRFTKGYRKTPSHVAPHDRTKPYHIRASMPKAELYHLPCPEVPSSIKRRHRQSRAGGKISEYHVQ